MYFCRLSKTEVWLWASLLIKAQELALVLMSLLIRSCCFMTLPPRPTLSPLNPGPLWTAGSYTCGKCTSGPLTWWTRCFRSPGCFLWCWRWCLRIRGHGWASEPGVWEPMEGRHHDIIYQSIFFFFQSHNLMLRAMMVINVWVKVISKE